jgi:hypothetical protein
VDMVGTASGNFYFDGNATISGKLTAQEFHTQYVTSSIIFESGSTKFGDSFDDTHIFTGSIYVDGSITASLYGTSSHAITASYLLETPTSQSAVLNGTTLNLNDVSNKEIINLTSSVNIDSIESGSVNFTYYLLNRSGNDCYITSSASTVVRGSQNLILQNNESCMLICINNETASIF